MSRNARIAVVAGLGIALLFVAGRLAGWWGANADENPRIYGNVEIREVELGFRVGGRLAQVVVDEGDKVTPGQELARLDTQPLRDRLAGADARVAAASALVARDVSGSRPQQLREAEAAVSDAEAQLGEAHRLHERRRALAGKGFISKADLQASEAAQTAANARVAAARAALSLAREGTRAEDRAATRAEAEAVSAERRAIQTDLSDTVLRAPSAGQVLTRVREAGAIVSPGEVV
ncbi:MAG TPA: biotin/lipoyl-binding protein, partial [Novosphingobium sp.]|nr:biotin/lipoyl-binding protein [Novosphingobium sp.]